jgi:hypothetical protein
LGRERSVLLWESMIITVTLAWWWQAGICRVAIFSVAEWPYHGQQWLLPL